MAIQALILAAGRGSRLGQLTDNFPKPLLQVGPKRLVEYQLEMLSAAGIGPVGMVLGYKSDKIVDEVGSQAEYLYNHHWEETNSLYSFLLARAWVDHDLLLMNCDLLLHPNILDNLLATGGDAFVYDSSSGEGREHMKVRLVDGKLKEMSKRLLQSDIDGENVGMLYFKSETATRLFNIAEELINSGHTSDWVGSAVEHLAQDIPLTGVDIAGLKWVEVDSAFDLEKARKEVLPALKKPGLTRTQFVVSVTTIAVLAFIFLTAFVSWFSTESQVSGPDWDTLTLSGVEAVTVRNEDKKQRWFELSAVDTATVFVTGPDTLRIESRPLMPFADVDELPYRLHINMDDVFYDQIDAIGRPSRMVQFENLPVGKRSRALVYVPDGDHKISVFLAPSQSVTSLVRIRQIDQKVEEDS